MMSGLEVAMAHVAGPAVTQEGGGRRERERKHTMRKTQRNNQERSKEGRSDWESHHTHRVVTGGVDNSQNEGWRRKDRGNIINTSAPTPGGHCDLAAGRHTWVKHCSLVILNFPSTDRGVKFASILFSNG